jgi:hypothetical protein
LDLVQDGGKKLFAGPDYWVVMTGNPSDGEGFGDRKPMDKALTNGVTQLKLGDLCEESWRQIGTEICGFGLGNLPETKPLNCEVEFYKNLDLVKIIADTLVTFHLEYRQALADDPVEKEREQKSMASQNDMFETAGEILATQSIEDNGDVNMAATFKAAVRTAYLNRHMEIESNSPDGQSLRQRMELALETLVDDVGTGAITLNGQVMSRGEAMNKLAKSMSLPADQRADMAQRAFSQEVLGVDPELRRMLGL